MAKPEHLTILMQGVKIWNQWRQEHLKVHPNLSGINLVGANLNGVDLQETNLSEANLTGATLLNANLSEADLRGATLEGAYLEEASFEGADFTGAILGRASFRGANLTRASFRNANLTRAKLAEASLIRASLIGTNLSEAELRCADLSEADVGWTNFGAVDLRDVRGLEVVNHRGPSTIGIDTLYRSLGNIPEVFLKGAGVDDGFIDYMRSLVGKPIEYYSCFISYSSKDDAFARRLYADLQSNNVRCWFAPEDLKWGERIRSGIDEAIHLHDKLLLILSKHSVASGWVEREVKTVLAREKKEKRTALFPVRLDRAVFDCPFEWATEIRHERNIGDFTRWKNHDDYHKAFARLLRDLKAAS